MLSFTTVHHLCTCLIEASTDSARFDWNQPPTLLLVHDWPLITAAPPRAPVMRSLEFPPHPDDMLDNPAGLPALLHHLAATLHSTPRVTPYHRTLDTIITRIRDAAPDTRLVAWAACYGDIDTLDGEPRQIRRVDAVDTDGRLYQLTHLNGEEHPLVLVDDTPDPRDLPATYPGLVALLAATARYAQPASAGPKA
ncbi:hypothetical protein [Micromonospora sp. WMMD710]|uniref:hypothetical protein n=1 Tax=Micromonospora sp. WMMD710 TaxID=3016085 RepID=UPI0024174869|nr:hypothetical protein [Micromonospora sp. WMMD710]MDG4760376.1 hypothetical protein [Micromonospora sp. WMMD710]